MEYKPFEPAFYHTDIADWGMALLLARAAGPQAKVLVDTGHHYAAQNIEQIVAWLLSEDMLGGFHFNDRRYADDDLTLGSIDPYQVFRIFHEIRCFEWETGKQADIAYMVDQSHNLKGKIEAMIQTVTMAQQLFAKSGAGRWRGTCRIAQKNCDLVARRILVAGRFRHRRAAGNSGVARFQGTASEIRMEAFRQSGYLERITKERARTKFTERLLLCLESYLTPRSLIWLSTLAPKADGPFWRIFSRGFSRPKKSIVSPMNRSNTADRFTGTCHDSGSKSGRLSRVWAKWNWRASASTHGVWTMPCWANAASCLRIPTTIATGAPKASWRKSSGKFAKRRSTRRPAFSSCPSTLCISSSPRGVRLPSFLQPRNICSRSQIYFNYWLTGNAVCEFTNATTTQMVDPVKRDVGYRT